MDWFDFVAASDVLIVLDLLVSPTLLRALGVEGLRNNTYLVIHSTFAHQNWYDEISVS